MRPEKRIISLRIPLTFDGGYKNNSLTNDKFFISGLMLLFWFVSSIVAILTGEWGTKLFYPLISFLIVTFIIRFIVIRENYYKKKKRELLDKNYIFDNNIFWDIYEVTASYPNICRYTNGIKSIFVRFDKDVIVGQDEDNDYNHFESISEGYLQMAKRNISCMHIDYMDTVGKDDRMESLFMLSKGAENSDLKKVLTRIFDNVKGTMQRSYASYDVYCFFYMGREELFWDELQIVLDYFMNANYIRYKILGKDDIGELVKSVMNLSKFSVNLASEKLFVESGGTSYIRPIWVEKDLERKILNKTREQIAEEQNIKELEKELKTELKKKKGNTIIEKIKENEEINLFDD